MPVNKNPTVVNLDPIKEKYGDDDRAIIRLFKTRPRGGKTPRRELKPVFGLYVFAGPQGSGKTLSAIEFMEYLQKLWTKRKKECKFWSNIPLLNVDYTPIDLNNIYTEIYNIDEKQDKVNIFLVDEMQVFFPRETKNKDKLQKISDMLDVMGQLRKRRVYVIGVAQVFGRIDKSIREQAVYLIDCKRTITGRIANYYYPAETIICDDLGRWTGKSKVIITHGLPSRIRYDTRHIVKA